MTAHLATAMALLGLLVFVFVRSFYPARVLGRGASQRFTLLAAFTAAAIYALLLFGSHVTATSQWYVFPDWPLMNGALLPPLTDANSAHVLHRWVAAVVGVIVWATALAAWRTQRSHPWVIRLAAHDGDPVHGPGGRRRPPGADRPRGVDPDAPPRARRGHLGALGEPGRRRVLRGPDDGRRDLRRAGGAGPDRRTIATTAPKDGPTKGDTVRAYIALTKPRIIELLLVTTIPAMVMATREIPGMQAAEWFRLVVLDARSAARSRPARRTRSTATSTATSTS